MSIPVITIKSSRTRLTLTYLSIIMALSIGFSTVFYFQSVSEARGNLAGQRESLSDFLYFYSPENIQTIQESQLGNFKRNLIKNLTALNVGMLMLGAAVSYILARRSLRPLEEALTQQGRFTSDAAHELRTPLTAMKTETEVALRMRSLTAKEARAVMRSNLEEIAKLETLTSALLRLARSSEKVDTSNWQDYKLADILRAARSRLIDKAEARKISIKLPKTKLVVHGDPDQLTELFVTLIGNAVKYSHDGGEVSIKATSNDRINVDVTDRGIGIAEVDLPHIFERFYRADQSRSKRGAEGYGLGLSLAEAIAATHGGKITVKSEYGKGSTFTVSLPKR